MPPILLINPNTSRATTRMMVAMARDTAGGRASIRGATAVRGPPMITTPEALDAAADGVVEIGMRAAGICAGVIVAAFGDPGARTLRERLTIPVIGICEAAMQEAAGYGGRFAVATTTPDLVARIAADAERLGLGSRFAGTWLTGGDPVSLVGDPAALEAALARAVEAAVSEGDAAAVIIGGGPLSRAAAALATRSDVPVIAPVAAAVRYLLRELGGVG